MRFDTIIVGSGLAASLARPTGNVTGMSLATAALRGKQLQLLKEIVPGLTIVAAHPGWPWIDEMTAVALHKGNVYWEMSGWAPKYLPAQLKVDIRSRLQDKVMFGSDYPSIPYDRLLREWQELRYSDAVMEKIFHQNAEGRRKGGPPLSELMPISRWRMSATFCSIVTSSCWSSMLCC
mgnify:CR=1 FL=1